MTDFFIVFFVANKSSIREYKIFVIHFVTGAERTQLTGVCEATDSYNHPERLQARVRERVVGKT